MKRLHWLLSITALFSLGVTSTLFAQVGAGGYQDYVISLEPAYYYQLNETTAGIGAVDTMGNGPEGIFTGDYVNGPAEVGVPGPDFLIEGGAWTTDAEEWTEIGEMIDLIGLGPDNLAHASNNNGNVSLGTAQDRVLFGAPAMTVAMFARGGGNAQGGDRLFTNNLVDPMFSFQVDVGNDGILVSVDPSVECDANNCANKSLYFPEEGVEFTNQRVDRGLISGDNGWWHIIASTYGTTRQERIDNISLWLNGVNRTNDMLPGTTGWGQNEEPAKIGGRREATHSTTHSGQQDEVAIWLGDGSEPILSDEEALALYFKAITPPPAGCDFDGNGVCDIVDLDELLYVGQANQDSKYDLNLDGTVDLGDRDAFLLDEQVGSLPGDADLNGEVKAPDLNAVGVSWQLAADSYAKGDFDGNSVVDAVDLNTLGIWWQKTAADFADAQAGAAAVPEPHAALLTLAGVMGLLTLRRRR